MATKKLVVELVGDDRSLGRALGRSEQKMARFGKVSSRTSTHLTGQMKKAVGAAVGAAAAYASIAGAKKAVATTEELAKTTLSLNKGLGLSVKTASQFGAVLKARGADTKSVNMAFASFSKNVEAAKKGTESAVSAFDALGVSQRELKSLKPEQIINQLSDGMKKLGPGTERTALSAKLFGRGWQTLGPLLRGGSAALREQLALAEKYGATFGGKSVKSIEDLIKAQREAKLASMGLQIAFGTSVAPALTKAIGTVSRAIADMRNGTGDLGRATQTYLGIVKSNWATASGVIRSVATSISGFMSRNREDIRAFGNAVTNVFNVVRAVTLRVWPGVRQIVQGVLRGLGGYVKIFSGLFTGDFRKMWEGVKQVFSGGVKFVGGIIRAASAPLRAAAAAAFGPIKSVASSVFNGIKKIVGDVLAGILRRFASLFDVASHIPGIGSKFKGLADKARAAARDIDGMGEAVKRLPRSRTVKVNLKMILAGKQDIPIPGLGGSGMAIDKGIQSAAQEFAANNRGKFAALFAGETGVLGKAKGSLGKAESIAHRFGLTTTSGFRPGDPGWHGKNRARDFGGSAGAMLKFAKYMYANFGGSLLELIHTPLGKGVKNGKSVPNSFYQDVLPAHYNHVHVAMQRGGMLPGRGNGDKVPVMAEPGEGFINKRAVKALGGRGAIDAINRMVPRFQSGGVVTAAKAAFAAGFRGDTLRNMVAIAGRESGYNPRAKNLKYPDHSIGLWQVNQLAHKGRFGTDSQLMDPIRNARAAFQLFKASGYSPWRGGSYARWLDDAARAIAAIGGKGKAKAKGKPQLQRHRLPSGDTLLGPVKRERIARDVTRGPAKGQTFRPIRPPRVITPLSEEQLSGMGGEDTAGPSGPSPAEILAEAIQAQADTSRELTATIAEQNRIAGSRLAIGLREAERVLADVISGQLGGRVAHRGATPSDGYTLARY